MEYKIFKIQIIDFGGRRILFDRRFHDYPLKSSEQRRRRDRRSGYDRRSVDNNIEPWDGRERRSDFEKIRSLIPGVELISEI